MGYPYMRADAYTPTLEGTQPTMHPLHERIPHGEPPTWIAVTHTTERYIHVFTQQTGHMVYLAGNMQIASKDEVLGVYGWRRRGHWQCVDAWWFAYLARVEWFGGPPGPPGPPVEVG